ncbi:DUF952 domain-containing protein [Streptomyces niveiscabiei]|uniref:DUF952 domain-containing protein n=1 Tax=Streptomyces niveiscabiei TaxID=164115 RepID=UPI0029ACE39F|nr:DUF952 domain-containing protein [Streptomyces niveiscabiei]MDX3386365.1 DUF952 domain-containing protein [Streptomyces niveiscabiei]
MSDTSSHVLHLTERALWEEAQETGSYEWSTRGRTLHDEGFVHCSTRDQLAGTAALVYGDDYVDLVVLVIDPARLGVPVRYEGGFPHVYGAVPVGAVVGVETWG